ncbi:MAG: hypothetical protein PHY74_04830 [Candidatus Bathyarchaeota archaeon]|nr:hypothetical protein [Candidatus Bathyarchaeota archaeon]
MPQRNLAPLQSTHRLLVDRVTICCCSIALLFTFLITSDNQLSGLRVAATGFFERYI